MRTRITLLFLSILVGIGACWAQTHAKVSTLNQAFPIPQKLSNGYWNFTKAGSKEALSVEEYDRVEPFSVSGFAIVKQGAEFHLVDAQGKHQSALEGYDSLSFIGFYDLYFAWKKGLVGVVSVIHPKKIIEVKVNSIELLNLKENYITEIMDHQWDQQLNLPFIHLVAKYSNKTQWVIVENAGPGNFTVKLPKIYKSEKSSHGTLYPVNKQQRLVKFVMEGKEQSLYFESGEPFIEGCKGEIEPLDLMENFPAANESILTYELNADEGTDYFTTTNQDGQITALYSLKYPKSPLIQCANPNKGFAHFRLLPTGSWNEIVVGFDEGYYFGASNKKLTLDHDLKYAESSMEFKFVAIYKSNKKYDFYDFNGRELLQNQDFIWGNWLVEDYFDFKTAKDLHGIQKGYRSIVIPAQYEAIEALWSTQYFGVKKKGVWRIFDIQAQKEVETNYESFKNQLYTQWFKLLKLEKGQKPSRVRLSPNLFAYPVVNGQEKPMGLIDFKGNWVVKWSVDAVIQINVNQWILQGFMGEVALITLGEGNKYVASMLPAKVKSIEKIKSLKNQLEINVVEEMNKKPQIRKFKVIGNVWKEINGYPIFQGVKPGATLKMVEKVNNGFVLTDYIGNHSWVDESGIVMIPFGNYTITEAIIPYEVSPGNWYVKHLIMKISQNQSCYYLSDKSSAISCVPFNDDARTYRILGTVCEISSIDNQRHFFTIK